MRSHHLALLSWLAAAPAALAQSPGPAPNRPPAEVRAMTQAILKEVDEHSQLMANLEYLCDVIGPRLTGSDNLKRANEWTRDKFTEYGL